MQSAIVHIARLVIGTIWVAGAIWLCGWQHWNGLGCIILGAIGLAIMFGDRLRVPSGPVGGVEVKAAWSQKTTERDRAEK